MARRSRTAGRFNRWKVGTQRQRARPTEEVRRRWQRFGERRERHLRRRSDGRAARWPRKPEPAHHQRRQQRRHRRIARRLDPRRKDRLRSRCDGVIIGFQLTHSGRFCRPHDKKRLEPRIAYRHPILDRKFGIDSDDVVLSDSDVERLIEAYVARRSSRRMPARTSSTSSIATDICCTNSSARTRDRESLAAPSRTALAFCATSSTASAPAETRSTLACA